MLEQHSRQLLRSGSRYEPSEVTAAHRTGITSADVTDLASIGDVTEFDTDQLRTLAVATRCVSGSVVTSLVVAKGYSTSNTFVVQGICDRFTLTTDGDLQDGSKYLSPDYFIDTTGANAVKVLVMGNPAAAVDLWLRKM